MNNMPAEIAAAIVAVMAKVTPLAKDGKNKFQQYSYVSVDQFFDAVGRLMADAGIFVLVFEDTIDIAKQTTTDDYGKTRESMWLSASYDFFIYHKTGASFGPIRRSIRVQASGPQSYASALSFAEKYFLRMLFKIPTGDLDEDSGQKQGLPAGATRRDAASSQEPDSANRYLDESTQFIGQSEIADELRAWWKHEEPARNAILTKIQAADLLKACKTRIAEMEHNSSPATAA